MVGGKTKKYFPFNATRSLKIAKWVAEIYWDQVLIDKCSPGNSPTVIYHFLLYPEHRDPINLELKPAIKVLWDHYATYKEKNY